MIALTTILSLLLVISTNAQQDVLKASPNASARILQPWLIGLTAVVVFLFIVFVLMIVNRVWFKKDKVNMNSYENNALDEEEVEYKKERKEENKAAMGQWTEDENKEQKVTPM
ncbi:small integral membrane protein 24 isoform X2 [Mixophyes fleayi]|uniref:small integral membrane protein 24 isoform X2 n=1 Tax=Mixophyes fleayi TaxID=3061075 RepID=UPI003F4E437E